MTNISEMDDLGQGEIMSNNFRTLEDLKKHCEQENAIIGFSQHTDVYRNAHMVNGFHVNNSIAILPMEGCDSTPEGSPGELTKKRYLSFAEGGAGLIWFEACAVAEQGRASKQQLFIHQSNLDEYKRMTDEIKESSLKKNGYTPLMIMQLTHSGRYSKPQGVPSPVLAAHNPILDEKYNISPDHKLISDAELKELEDQFAEAARLAERAGFDGVDIKASHGYLLSELLSSFTRDSEYGGDYNGRTRFIKNAVKKIKQAVGSQMVLGSRFGIYDAIADPLGFGTDPHTGLPDLKEPAKLLNELYEMGVHICAVTMGNPYFNPHVGRPFDSGAYVPPESPVKGVERLVTLAGSIKRMVPGMLFIGAGYSWLREFAVEAGAYTLENQLADFVGFGRQAFAFPAFSNEILQKGCIARQNTCMTCSKCSELMRSMLPAGCVIREKAVYAPLYQKHIKTH